MRSELAVLLVVLVGLAAAASTGGKLGSRCSIKKDSLKTIEDLNSIVELAMAADSGCEPTVVEALSDMKAITDDTSACTMKKAQAITDFVGKYLREPSETFPKALADFAVGYGMQVSGVCSRDMVDSFPTRAEALIHDKLGANNYDLFVDFKIDLVERSSIGLILRPIVDTGEVVLPADLIQAMPEVKTKLQLQLSKRDYYDKLKMVCAKMLKPLYEPTMLPLAHLIKNGFINRSDLKSKEFKRNGRFWSTAVFLCESLDMIDIEERNTAEQRAIEAKLGEAYSGLKPEELDRGDNGDDGDDGEVSESAPVESVPIRAGQSDTKVDNKIMNSSVKRLVKAYKANKSEADRIRERIAARTMRLIRALAKNGESRHLLAEVLNLIKIQDDARKAEFERARQSLLRYIESPEREKAALMSEVSKSTCPAAKGDEGSSRFEKKGLSFGECLGGAIAISLFWLWRFSGIFAIIGYVLVFTGPYLLILLLTSPFGSCNEYSCLREGARSLDAIVFAICGWPDGLFQ